jgi:anti-sigma-K factor RskA
MTCEELRPEYGAYALGISEDPERSEIGAHIARHCPVCVPGVTSAREVVAKMSGAVKLVDPPKQLRGKVLRMVGGSERSWTLFLPWGIAAVLAVVLLSVGVPGILNPPAPQQKIDEVLAVLNDPTAKDVSFGVPTARGRVFVSPGKGIVLIAAQVPQLDENHIFEMWVIPAKGNPVPSGLFRGNSDSTAMYVHPGPVDSAAAVAVTVEPKSGSAQPTTTPFIVTKL